MNKAVSKYKDRKIAVLKVSIVQVLKNLILLILIKKVRRNGGI